MTSADLDQPAELKFLNTGDYEERPAFVFMLARYRLVYYEGKKYTQEPETNEAEYSVRSSLVVRSKWEPLASELRTRCDGPTEMLLLVTSTNVNARNNTDHFSNVITADEERKCICYFEASLGGAQSGFYAGPAHFDRKNAPLEVLAFDPASPSMWNANFALADYATGETGVKPVLGFSLLDNAGSLFVVADPDKPERALCDHHQERG